MTNISGRFLSGCLATVLVAGGMAVTMTATMTMGAKTALAGFEFSPPPKAAPAAAPAAVPDAIAPAPAGAVDMMPLPGDSPVPPPSNVDISAFPMKADAPASPASSPAAPPLGASSPVVAPIPAAPIPESATIPAAASAPQPPAPADGGANGFATVSGFGKDIPLVLAMRQIIPADYAYSFDPKANAGARVSWDGGRPWNAVLADAIEPYGMKVAVLDKTVRIMPASAAVPAPSAPVAPALSRLPAPPPVAAPASYPPRVPPVKTAIPAARPGNGGMLPMTGAASLPLPVPAPQPVAPAMIYPVPAPAAAAKTPDDQAQSYPHRQPHRHILTDQSSPGQATPILTQPDSIGMTAPTPPPPASTVAAKVTPSWFYSSGQHSAAQKADDVMTAPSAPSSGAFVSPAMPSAVTTPAPLSSMAPAAGMPTGAPLALSNNAAADPVPAGSQDYNALEGQSLKMVLQQWSKQAGVDLAWTSISDYTLPNAVHTTGTFADAVKLALQAYRNDPDRPVGTLHTNTQGGAPVLEIKSYAASANAT